MVNQKLDVKIGKFGILQVYHKTQMGSTKDVLAIGNLAREQKGLRTMELREILCKQSFWEFVVSLHNSNYPESGVLEIDYDKVKNKSGKIDYSQLVPKFPDLIQSKPGRYGGTWAHIYVLLKMATMLDSDVEVLIYKLVLESQLLANREDGGEEWKRFKKNFCNLPDRVSNKECDNELGLKNMAMFIRGKSGVGASIGWNSTKECGVAQKRRVKLLKFLNDIMEAKLVHGYLDLHNAIKAKRIR